MRWKHFTIIMTVLFIQFPLNGYTLSSHDVNGIANILDITQTLNVEEDKTNSDKKVYHSTLVAQSGKMETEGVSSFKPEYNIVIQNQTNHIVNSIIVKYGGETFNIDQIDSYMFKMRNFVDYEIPETVIFQWQDYNGKKYRKKLPVP